MKAWVQIFNQKNLNPPNPKWTKKIGLSIKSYPIQYKPPVNLSVKKMGSLYFEHNLSFTILYYSRIVHIKWKSFIYKSTVS